MYNPMTALNQIISYLQLFYKHYNMTVSELWKSGVRKFMEIPKIEKLYELLERAGKERDLEDVAALRWAIFSLENYPQTQDLEEV